VKIAIIGSGVSGLVTAHLLHGHADVVVFEARPRVGGHVNTVEVEGPRGRRIAVDTGFIVYNEVTYPHLTRLFAALGVPTEASDMSFAFSRKDGVEYGASLGGVLARPSNLFSGRFRRMLTDIGRFRRVGADLEPLPGETISALLSRHGFSAGFGEDYLFPMTSAIWSARTSDIREFPAASILQFLANHGLIEIVGRPKWRTVAGGSRSYVELLIAPFRDRIRTASPVESVRRSLDGPEVTTRTSVERHDEVILATHSDQALAILGDAASPEERSLLGSIRYQPNTAVLHSDISLMPRRRAVWSSWNAMATSNGDDRAVASVTYWMNRLQNLRTSVPVLVSLNPVRPPDPSQVYASFAYAHPQYDEAAIDAASGLARIQGSGGVWYAGAYLGYGFHEDGLQAGLNVAAALGSPVPWHDGVKPMSSTPPIPVSVGA
jgi:predicted NAD/FAD-binding protein